MLGFPVKSRQTAVIDSPRTAMGFEEGDLQSRAIGRKLGAQVWSRAQGYFDGTVR